MSQSVVSRPTKIIRKCALRQLVGAEIIEKMRSGHLRSGDLLAVLLHYDLYKGGSVSFGWGCGWCNLSFFSKFVVLFVFIFLVIAGFFS